MAVPRKGARRGKEWESNLESLEIADGSTLRSPDMAKGEICHTEVFTPRRIGTVGSPSHVLDPPSGLLFLFLGNWVLPPKMGWHLMDVTAVGVNYDHTVCVYSVSF
jgi:hypothetical protein